MTIGKIGVISRVLPILAVVTGMQCGFAPTASADRPNVVFVFFDDLRWDMLSFTGNTIMTTPHIDKLAEHGTIFENAFVTESICAPSRASTFMGQHMARHGVRNFNSDISAEQWVDSYPARLKKDGYYMGYVGKHHLPGDFTGKFGTFDYNKGYTGGGTYFDMTIDGEEAGDRHLTQFLGDLSVAFIEKAVDPEHNSSEKPFLLQIGFKAPHVQNENLLFQNDPAYDHLYEDDVIPRAKTDSREQFLALPDHFHSGSAARGRWNSRFSTEESFQNNIKDHHRLVHGVDVQVGRIMEALETNGLMDNTIIIVSSDNGFFLGERQQAGKWYIQEESIRIPLVVYDPHQPEEQRGKRVPQMSLIIDLPATILDYAGTAIPDVMQGRSLKPIIDGNPPSGWRTEFFYDHPQIGPTVFRNQGVRTESFVFARYPNHGNVKQLYDVTVDPYQRTDLSRDPRYAEVLAELDALTTQLEQEVQ